MKNIEKRIRETAKELLEGGKIDLFIGYQAATLPLKSRPLFIRSKKDAADGEESPALNLVWNSFCSNNLAVFLPKLFEIDPRVRRKDPVAKPRVGIIAKGCDLRSITTLIKEKQIPRENVFLIGVPCTGMIDNGKVEALFSGDEIIGADEIDGILKVKTRKGMNREIKREDVLQECCSECRFPLPSPESTDILIEGKAKEPGPGDYPGVQEFESRTPEERWEYFKQEMSKCIRCNACRQACPTCWCKECFADQDDLRWIGVSTELSDTMIFHLIRMFHQAGRCVGCDACYRACPMGVDIRTFTRSIAKDVDELFGYVPDFNLEETPPLSTFAEGDSEEFITDVE
jgi:formate dehydrogenase subunit beta